MLLLSRAHVAGRAGPGIPCARPAGPAPCHRRCRGSSTPRSRCCPPRPRRPAGRCRAAPAPPRVPRSRCRSWFPRSILEVGPSRGEGTGDLRLVLADPLRLPGPVVALRVAGRVVDGDELGGHGLPVGPPATRRVEGAHIDLPPRAGPFGPTVGG